MRTFKVELDTAYADKAIKETGLLQGNQNFAFEFRLAERGEPITIDNMKKPKLIFNFENGVESFTVDESSPDYPVTVAGNVVKVAASKYLSMGYGRVKLMIKIDDYYTYSCIYYVDRNENFTAPPVVQSDAGDFALKDFKNVSNDVFRQKYKEAVKEPMSDADFLTQAKKNGLAENDLADVDLQKLYDKGIDSGLMSKDGSNFSPSDFDRELKANAAFRALQNADHPAISGKTDEEIKKLFYANRYEEVNAVDLTQDPFDKPTTLLMVYQMNVDGGTIKQVLPPHITNQIIMVEMIFASGVTNATLEIDVVDGEHLEGNAGKVNHMTFTKQGYLGYFIPIKNTGGYEFISHYETMISGLVVKDSKGNVSLGVKDITFDDSFALEDSGDTVNIKLAGSGDAAALPFIDGQLGQEFIATKVQSSDKTVRIANLGGVADLSVNAPLSSEGIMAVLGSDQMYNSKFPKSAFYFSDVKHDGGSFVYVNKTDKTFVIQEIDQGDPNVTGGTNFLVGLSYVPSRMNANIITQDGYFRIEFADKNGELLNDIYGNPAATEIHYKAGQKERKQLYLGIINAKAYEEIRPRFDSNFTQEEAISIGAETAIVIQPITKDFTSGLALLNFMAYTGYTVNLSSRYYGVNNVNFARTLIFDAPEQEVEAGEQYLGNDLFLDFQTKAKLAISNYHMVLKDNGVDLPVYSLYKRYNKLDTILLKQQAATATVKAVANSPRSGFKISLLKYTGKEEVIPSPKVLSYLNENPQFSAGWSIIDSLFVGENIDGQDIISMKSFAFETDEDIREFAFVLYAIDSQIPLELYLKDFEVDIVPDFTRIIITDNSNIQEESLLKHKEYYKSLVSCPSGDISYRYTAGATDTKVPIGVMKGGDGKIINNHDWTDVGSSDPHKVQGSFEFKADGKVNFEYGAQLYNEKATINNAEFWLAKDNGDGSFTEVPNSRYATTVEANRTKIPKSIVANSFSFEVKENEVYRMLMKSDIDDGFYIQCTPNGVPLFYASIVFDEVSTSKKDILQGNIVQVMEDGKPVTGKTIQIDSKTGAITIK